MKYLLQGGLVHQGDRFLALDVRIENTTITEIAPSLTAHEDERVINCSGKHIMPGAIDAHVHFREPGLTHKEDFLSGSKAALAGGVTTILDMPNTKPPVVSKADLEHKRDLAKKSLVNYGLYVLGCVENQHTIGEFTDVPGIKIYLGSSTGNYLTDDLGVFATLLKNANVPVVVHAENEDLLKHFFELYKETQLHHKMRDNLAAVVSVAEASITASYFGKQLHIAHMSTKEEVDFLRKNKTPHITCEVCPHHLFLTEAYFCAHKNYGKMNPPLRYQKDQEALWDALREGIIDIVSTDHAPHTHEEKSKDFWSGPCGVPGVQTMVPLLLHAVNEGKLTLEDVVKLVATNPAKIFKFVKRGALKVGNYADITVVDMQKEGTIKNEEQYSKCGWTPFHGMNIKGWPVMTFVNGTLAYSKGQINEVSAAMQVEVTK